MTVELQCPYCGNRYVMDKSSSRAGLRRCGHCGKRFSIKRSETDQFQTERARKLDRYQIITYDRDGGTDEKLEYQKLSDAIIDAEKYLDGTYDGFQYEGVIIYDQKEWTVLYEYGYWPEGARPREGKPV